MSVFGWSYPPGCSGPEECDTTCAVCGRDQELNQCICPECPECGSHGDPVCYEQHGMERSQEQIASRAKIESQWAADAKAEFNAEQAAERNRK